MAPARRRHDAGILRRSGDPTFSVESQLVVLHVMVKDRAGGGSLYDAISASLGHLRRGTRERRVLVVVSDGGDNASRATRESAIRQAQDSNAVIYTIALVDPIGARGGNPAWLKELAQASGGESFRSKDARGIADALRAIVESIRHTCTLGYVSDDTARDGPFDLFVSW